MWNKHADQFGEACQGVHSSFVASLSERQELAALCNQRLHALQRCRSIVDEQERLVYELSRCNEASLVELSDGIVNVERENAFYRNPQENFRAELLEQEEALDKKRRAIDQRLEDMRGLMKAIEDKREGVVRRQKEMSEREMSLADAENDYASWKHDRDIVEFELDDRRRGLGRRESNISTWNRTLETRNVAVTKMQVDLESRLKHLHSLEERLGIKHAPSTATHNLSIDREDEV